MNTIGKKFSIFWKIIFWICSISLIIVGIKNGGHHNKSIENISELMGFIFSLFVTAVFFTLGYFWSLGYKKKLFTDIFNNINLGLLTLFVVGGPIFLGFFRGKPIDSNIEMVASLLTCITVMIIAFIITSPLYLALFQYKKFSGSFETIKAPYIKLLAFCTLITLQLSLVFNNLYQLLTSHNFNFLTALNMHSLKYIAFYIAYVYGLLFLIGMAFDKKIFPQKFWQYTSIPFVIITIADFFHSKADTAEILKFPITLKLFLIVAFIFLFKILYDYAFTKLVYKSEEESITDKGTLF